MCFSSKPKVAPQTPPPPPPAPTPQISLGSDQTAVKSAQKKKRLGISLLQIPLVSNPTSGLGIPTQGSPKI